MSAVWSAARAAVKRRRIQTLVIALVVLTSTVTLVVALGLLDAASAPFESTFAQQRGAQLTVTYDAAKVSDAQLADSARKSGVTDAAGPFAEVVLTAPPANELTPTPGVDDPQPGPVVFVGRADPGGPVDRVDVWKGRWAQRPGEVVLMRPPGQRYQKYEDVGSRFVVPGAPPLTIVGFASSLSQTAGAWVVPDQLAAMHPTSTEMLYRFAQAGSAGQLGADLATVSSGLPQGSVLGSLSYLTIRNDLTSSARAYVPFLLAFGILGLVVAVLITANVVSGAVVSGFRHIGVLKALGFTPNQAVAVYLVMVLVPGVVGGVLGTVLGGFAAQPLLRMSFQGFNSGYFTPTLNPWIQVETLVGMPLLVLLAALLPALRAHGLSAARAISAGSAPSAGRGLWIQRRLSGSRLPRSVSLGLGLPFARPGRTALTMMSLVLGVLAVTLATGLGGTITAFVGSGQGHMPSSTFYDGVPSVAGQIAPKLTDQQIEAKLRSLPGASKVTAEAPVLLHLAGDNQAVHCWFARGDSEAIGDPLLEGHWPTGPDEIMAGTSFAQKRGLVLGSHLTMELNGRQQSVTLVGLSLNNNPDEMSADWPALTSLAPGPTASTYVNQYWVRLAHGTDVDAYDAAAKAAEPGLEPSPAGGTNSITVTIVGTSSVLSILLGTVAGLGVFNTVVLNARERRRDLGMLKSIGMTPRQVTAMMVTSMAALGVVGSLIGVPLGILAHRVVIPAMTKPVGLDLPASMLDVWHPMPLTLVALAGVAIAVLGALLPARSAARLPIAQVLRSE
ncbi:putative ABC transport system permease protein [Kitasatospora sp. MAP12-15]|uniref:ABC transporter permease n=1 Tax=unclassified Kitasatospora TaxID=2633591 RepID=UPI002472F9F7|nr:ABC transporter permease [Kitasatospora sp. MAP12-44]MDH6110671.1 putative ABC transport system permease protein [Kitasatospora sp. MAP12-44]